MSINDDIKNHPFLRQFCSCVGVYIIAIGFNAVVTCSSILIPKMQVKKSEVVITNSLDISLVASLTAVPLSFGTLLNGYLMDRYGRKQGLLFSQIPTSGWLFIGFSDNIYMVFIGRFLTGWSAGMCSVLSSIYIAEIATARYRAILLALMTLSVNMGMLTTHILGQCISLHYVAVVVFAFAVVGVFAIAFFTFETPFWLIINDRYAKCVRTSTWLSGVTEEALLNTPEFEELKRKAVQIKSVHKDYNYCVHYFVRPEFYKPLIIICMFFLIAQFSGQSAISFYSMSLFKDFLGLKIPQGMALLTVDSLRVFWSLVSVFLMHFLPRRLLAITSCAGVSFSLLFLSIHGMVCQYRHIEYNYSVPLISMIMYISFISIGLMPLPWCMIGEFFSVDNKGFGASISATVCFIAAFVVVKALPYMFVHLGPNATFLIYGFVALFGTIYIFYFLPETRYSTLTEIQDSFKE